MNRSLRILSLGAGVQSTTVLLMAYVNEIEPIHAAIFADTGWEPEAVYNHLGWLTSKVSWKIPVAVVGKGNIREDALRSRVRGTVADGSRWASLPFFTPQADGKIGMLKRQCTREYKMEPVRRKVREFAGLEPRQGIPKGFTVELLMGISWDEADRVNDSRVKYIRHIYPLIEKRMTRLDCLKWIEAHSFPRPPRSACIGCPFHNDLEWFEMRRDRPEEFADVVAFDAAIRDHGGLRGQVFLHRSCKPLDKVIFYQDATQDMFRNECMGLCGT